MPLDDRVLRQVIEGSGRVYAHEAKDMATELMDWRSKRESMKRLDAPGSRYCRKCTLYTPGGPIFCPNCGNKY